jgi:hypothetical protein
VRQLASLTQLSLSDNQPCDLVDVPHVRQLGLRVLEVETLGKVIAPQLQRLQAPPPPSVDDPFRYSYAKSQAKAARIMGADHDMPNDEKQAREVIPVWLSLKAWDAKQQALLQQHGSQLLRWCNALWLRPEGALTKDDATAALAALWRSWKPDPSVLQPNSGPADSSVGSSSSGGGGDGTNLQPRSCKPIWKLVISKMPCTRAGLEGMPLGLTHLDLQ